MNAVIYARYSSDNQREESIEGQLRECTEFAKKNDITILRHYIDRAYSAKTDNRPEFQNMIKDGNKKLFDLVIVWKLDRFARNRYDSARYKAALKKNGIKVVSATKVISNGAEGIILESVLEGYAEYYSADLSEKVIRGMTENTLKGKHNGGTTTIGYIVNKKQQLEIDPVTAPFVLEAFRRYDEGCTMKDLMDWLNTSGFTNTRGGPVSYNTIQHMLKNRRYIGEYRFRDIVLAEVVPPIVPVELFNRVQERMVQNKRAPARHKAIDDYLLTTKLFCGYCGSLLFGECGTSRSKAVYHYYKCATVKRRTGDCKKKPVRKKFLEDLVVEAAMELVSSDAAIEVMVSLTMDLQERENTTLPLLERQLHEADTGIQNLLNAIQQGILTKSTKDRLEALEAQKEECENKIALEKLTKPKVSAEFVEYFLRRFRDLDVSKLEHRRVLIDTFINSIFLYENRMIITFNYRDGQKIITFADLEGSDLKLSAAPQRSKRYPVCSAFLSCFTPLPPFWGKCCPLCASLAWKQMTADKRVQPWYNGRKLPGTRSVIGQYGRRPYIFHYRHCHLCHTVGLFFRYRNRFLLSEPGPAEKSREKRKPARRARAAALR